MKLDRMIKLLCIFSMGVAFAFPRLAGAQQRIDESEWKRGYHGLNMICSSVGLVHTPLKDWQKIASQETVVIILGSVKRLPLNVDSYLQRGGAVLIANDQQGAKAKKFRHGLGFDSTNARAILDRDVFRRMYDCPIVKDIRFHPSLKNVESIVTNRPGVLIADRRATIAYLPALQESLHSNPFVATVENPQGGKFMGVADQSVFSNQMIVQGDNALFAKQSLDWLKGQKRKHVLMIADGKVKLSVDPSDVELALPPPTRQEVLDALKNLPPSALLEFGNSVATVLEDGDMVNEFVNSTVDKVPDVKMNRAFIFLTFAIVCLFAVLTYVGQKKLMRQTASEVAALRNRRVLKHRKSNEAYERQMAAGVLLDSFCVQFTNRRYNDWPDFPNGLATESDPEAKSILHAMALASSRYQLESPSYWTPSRLRALSSDVDKWKSFFRSKLATSLGASDGNASS